MTWPRQRGQAGEDAFPGYLHQARALLASLDPHVPDGPTGLPPDVEALRWFSLPPDCASADTVG
jgi:hypothetical protein